MLKSRCNQCGKVIEIGQWAWCPHEPLLAKPLTQPAPIVVYRNAKGDIQFPGRANEPVPARLAKLGYARIEIPFREAHKLEREMNTREKLRFEKHKQREYEIFGARRRDLNSQLRQMAQHFSPQGREMVQECMRRYDQKSSCPSFDPGFHIDVLHNDSSSRGPWVDRETQWKKKWE